MPLCINCKKKIYIYKIINNVRIFFCPSCGLGVTQDKLNIHKVDTTTSLYDFNTYSVNEEKYRLRFNKLIDLISKYKRKGIILEIGGGFGLFSSLLTNSKQYQIEVIEPYLKPIYLIGKKNVYIYKCTFEDFIKKDINKQFDVVILLDVLEHFKNPSYVINKIQNILKENGIIVIQVPNYNSLMANLCRNWSWWMTEEHKYHFSLKALTFLLKTNDFDIKKCITYEDFSDFKKNLDGNFIYIRNSIIRKSAKLIFYSLFFPFYLIFKRVVWHLGYGGLLFVIAKKSNSEYI